MDAIDEQQLDIDLENLGKLYLNTRDGRALWSMFLTLHQAGKQIPQNLLDKFAEWAPSLLAANSPQEVCQALDLAGDNKKYKGPAQQRAYDKRWQLASKVLQYLDLYGGTQTQALRDTARNCGVSVATVKKAYHEVFTKPLRNPKRKAKGLDAAMRGWLR
jgi:hypothetical protein